MEKLRKAVTWVGMFLFPIIHFYLIEAYTHSGFTKVRPWSQLFNIMLYELVMLLLFFVFRSLKRALRVQGIVTMVIGLVNYYVYTFRSLPLVPWDILSVKTALSVADNYNFMPTPRVVLVLLGFIIVLLAEGFCELSLKEWNWKRTVLSIAAVTVVLTGFTKQLQQEEFQNSHKLYNKLFTPVHMWQVNGFALTMVMEWPYLSVESPRDYNKQKTEEVLAAYTKDKAIPERLPHIIAIMDEAFSDLAVLGEFNSSEAYMPFFDSLCANGENVISGNLYVSVCGGNTANTEFEFLTGNSMAYLPQGSIPYQQYINDKISALPAYLRSLGYKTFAMHPYNAGGWDRDTVYPLLGFESMEFLPDYTNREYIREYVSDKTCVEKIIDTYENKTEGNPAFIFNVTMQNHGSYGDAYGNFTPHIKVEGAESFSLSTYLSLIKKTDEALEILISYFEKEEEPVVVVFFGDHQPNDAVAQPIWSLQGKSYKNLSEEDTDLRYQVPYLIWANYDIENGIEGNSSEDTINKVPKNISANYLADVMLEAAGIPKSAYGNFRMELMQRYPVISAQRVENATGEVMEYDIEDDWLRMYQKMQYYYLFDMQNKE